MRIRKSIILFSIIIFLVSYCAPLALAVEEIANNEVVDNSANEVENDIADNTDSIILTDEEIENRVEEENKDNIEDIEQVIANEEITEVEVQDEPIVENTIKSEEVLEVGNQSVENSTTEAPTANPSVIYSTHIQNIGWQDYKKDGELSGTEGKSLRLEGIKISLKDIEGSVSYQTHIQDIGWQDIKKDNQMSGTEGKSLRLEAIKISLSGIVSEQYNILYRVHVQNYGWLGWAKNNELARNRRLWIKTRSYRS